MPNGAPSDQLLLEALETAALKSGRGELLVIGATVVVVVGVGLSLGKRTR